MLRATVEVRGPRFEAQSSGLDRGGWRLDAAWRRPVTGGKGCLVLGPCQTCLLRGWIASIRAVGIVDSDLLRQHLHRYASLMCNGYGGLNLTNRERVNLKSLEQARDYFAEFPHPERGTGTERAMNEALRLSGEKPGK
jgi:hypothetical protein